MRTLPIIHLKKFRVWGPSTQLPVSSIVLITLVIGIQVKNINCSGSVNLARPYLFRDFGMPAGQVAPLSAHAQLANLYHSHQFTPINKKSSQSEEHEASSHSSGSYLEYFDDIGSSEEDPGLQYTAPLILDIDDPEKGRWIEFNKYREHDDAEDYIEEYEEGSISSTEFQSRSGLASATEKQESETSSQQQQQGKPDSSSRSSDSNDGDKRGILDYLGNPLMNFWQSSDDTEQIQPQSGADAEMSQDDGEIPYFDYQQYAYLPYGNYDYDETNQYQQYFESLAQSDQGKPSQMMMMMKPQIKKPKQPKPMKAVSKPKQKPKSKPKAKKPKPKPKKPIPMGMPMPMMPRPIKVKKKQPSYSQQFHYQEISKPDKLTMVKEKLAKLNPFRYVPQIQIQKPQIKIEKIPSEMPPRHGPPPRRRPPMPMRRPKPPMMIPMKIKMKKPPKQKQKNKPKKPKQPKPPKQSKPKPSKKPHGEEANPEFVMIVGENPYFASDQTGATSQSGEYYSQEEGEDTDAVTVVEDDEEEEAEEEDDDDDDDEEEEEDEEDDYNAENVEYGIAEDGSMTVLHGGDEETEASLSDDETILVEDDEAGPYEDSSSSGLFGSLGKANGATRTNGGGGSVENNPDGSPEQKEKSIGITKYFGIRRRKKHRRPPKPKPARRPPHWKEYRPAPLLPEIPDGLSDALLKVVKNVGFLPEYGKDEKYGGHNKIKGKYTKTRPITLHHGLLTEVV